MDRPPDPLADHRDGRDVLVFRGEGEGADEPVLPVGPAVGSESPHGHVERGARTVHSGLPAGQGQHQRVCPGIGGGIGGSRVGRVGRVQADGQGAVLAQQAQPGLTEPVSEKHEMAIGQPAQQRRGVLGLLVGHRRWIGPQFVGQPQCGMPHLLARPDDLANVVQHGFQPRDELMHPVRSGDPVDLEAHPRLDGRAGRRELGIGVREHLVEHARAVPPDHDDRVHDVPQPQAPAIQLVDDRIDQVRHVVGDHLDQGGRRRLPVAVGRLVTHLDQRPARRADERHAMVRADRLREHRRGRRPQLVRRVVIQPDQLIQLGVVHKGWTCRRGHDRIAPLLSAPRVEESFPVNLPGSGTASPDLLSLA